MSIVNITVLGLNGDKGKYNFSFTGPVPKKNLRTISLVSFRKAFEALNGAFAHLGSNGARDMFFCFIEPELGLVSVKVKALSEDKYDTEVLINYIPSGKDLAYLLK